jgi:hypothetical protein
MLGFGAIEGDVCHCLQVFTGPDARKIRIITAA